MHVYMSVEGGSKDNSGALPMLMPLYNRHNARVALYSPDVRLMFANILMGEMTVAHLTRGKRDLARAAHQLNGV